MGLCHVCAFMLFGRRQKQKYKMEMNILGDTMLQLDDDVYHAKIEHIQAWCKKKYGDRFKPKE